MPTSQTALSKQPQAIKMLMQDHREVEKLYKQFEKLSDDADEEKAEIIDQVCNALLVHAQLEEEIFYPAVKDQIREHDLVDEAEVEHQSAKDLIAQLQSGELDSEKRDATFKVLCEYVMHHVQEEEKELFPQVKKAKDIDLDELGEEMAERRMELDEDAEGVSDEAPATKRAKKVDPVRMRAAAIAGRNPMWHKGNAARATPANRRDRMQKVSEVMTRDVEVLTPTATIEEAAQLMDELNVGSVPVCDGRRLCGMLTDRDITVRAVAAGLSATDTPVSEIMTETVHWCREDMDVQDIAEQMADIQIRRMPVIDTDNNLIGIVSLGDIATKGDIDDASDALQSISSPSEPDRPAAY